MNEWMNEWMFNDTPARKTDRTNGMLNPNSLITKYVKKKLNKKIKKNYLIGGFLI